MCIDIVAIWFGNANGQISSIFVIYKSTFVLLVSNSSIGKSDCQDSPKVPYFTLDIRVLSVLTVLVIKFEQVYLIDCCYVKNLLDEKHSAASDLGLLCLHMPICANT